MNGMENGETLLLNAIKRGGFMGIFLGLAITLFIVPLPIVLLSGELSKGKTIMEQGLFLCPAVAILILLFSIALLVKGIKERTNPKESKLFRMITEKPEEIVWVYKKVLTTHHKAAYVVTVAKSQNYSLIFVTKDKKKIELQVKGEFETDAILRYLQEKLTKTVFGFSESLNKEFK